MGAPQPLEDRDRSGHRRALDRRRRARTSSRRSTWSARPTDRPAGRGANFGWSAFEGTERFNTDVADLGPIPPVLTYRHGDDGCSISGGVPYRGTAIAELEPAYVYSDYCSGKVWALDLAGGRNLTLLDGFSSVTAVRAGPDGELYVLEAGGTVHRLVPG